MNKLVSIKDMVFEALGDMGIDHGKNIPDFMRWVCRAERAIGSYYSLRKKIVVLTIDKYRACLPNEAMFVQRVVWGDYGNTVYDLFDQACAFSRIQNVAANATFLVIDKPNENDWTLSTAIPKWEVQDNHIIFPANYDKQKITVQCLCLETDNDGFPRVCENHLEAVVEYLMYRQAKRSRFSPSKMELGDVKMLKQEWEVLAAEARAADAELSESDRDQIVAMIHDPFVGHGFEAYGSDY